MASRLVDELQTMYIKFDQAERKWTNRFDELDTAYKSARDTFNRYLPISAPGGSLERVFDFVGQVSVGALGLSGMSGAIAVPIVLGLKALGGFLDSPVSPPTPDVLKIKTSLEEMRSAFRDTTEHLGDQISRLLERAKNAATIAVDRDLRNAVSKLLLSPVWYPPEPKAFSNLARPIEMRMWFLYFSQLKEMGYGAVHPKIDYSPMVKHLRSDIEWNPPGVTVEKYALMSISPWARLEIINTLADDGAKRMPLHLNHQFPAAVTQYIKNAAAESARAKLLTAIYAAIGQGYVVMRSGDEALLPSSTLTWADV